MSTSIQSPASTRPLPTRQVGQPMDDGNRSASAAEFIEHPWVPGTVGLSAVVFGVLACGVIAGVNFTRLGLRHYLVPCILLGILLSLLHATILAFFFPHSTQLVGLLMNVAVGLGFLQFQKPVFEKWRADHAAPKKQGERYKQNRNGLLASLAVLGLLIQLALTFLIAAFAPVL